MQSGVQFEDDFGRMLAIGAEFLPYIGLNSQGEVGVFRLPNFIFFHLVSTPCQFSSLTSYFFLCSVNCMSFKLFC